MGITLEVMHAMAPPDLDRSTGADCGRARPRAPLAPLFATWEQENADCSSILGKEPDGTGGLLILNEPVWGPGQKLEPNQQWNRCFMPFLNPPTEMYLGTVLNNGEQFSRRSQRGLLRCLAKGTHAIYGAPWIPSTKKPFMLALIYQHHGYPWIPWQYFTIIW